MASVETAWTPSPDPASISWEDLNREWGEFWAALAARAATPATTWLTPERRTRLQGLLDQGGEWLAAQPSDLPERELYACHLRRLLPALEALQREFAKTAALLQRQRSQLQAARDWAGAQPRRHDAHLR